MASSTEQFVDRPSFAVRFARSKPLTLFFLLTYAWTWTWWLGLPRFVPDDKAETLGELLFLAGAFGPTVGALITRWLSHRDLRICRVWTGWYSLASGLAFGLAAGALTAGAIAASHPYYYGSGYGYYDSPAYYYGPGPYAYYGGPYYRHHYWHHHW